MFANLNLQLTSLLTSGDAGLAGAEDVATTGLQDSDGMLSFSEFFSMSTEEAQQLLAADGEILPQDGKPLPPEMPLPDATTPDKMIGAGEEPPAPPELLLEPATVLQDAELVDVELELTLDYSGNEIPAENSTHIPEETLVLPPGLTLTAITPGRPNTQNVPPDNFSDAPHKTPQPVTLVPPGPPPATLAVPVEVAAEAVELAFPQPPASVLRREQQTRSTQQTPLAAAPLVSADTRQTTDLRYFTEQQEIARQVAAIESQRHPEPRFVTVPPGPQLATVSLGATPSSIASDLNVLRTELPVDTISTPVRQPGWGEKLAERVVMLAGAQTKTAEIRLTPAELGPLRVQISVDDGQAHVAFHAHNAVTREAIEQALPRLREMLAESGLTLGQADVGEQGVAGGERDQAATAEGVSGAQGDLLEEGADGFDGGRQKSVISNGLVDTFA